MARMTATEDALPQTAEQRELQAKINYWKEKNIVPFFKKEKKGFMNLPEALWLMIKYCFYLFYS